MEPTKVQFNKNSEERRKRRTKFLFVALLLCVLIIVGIVSFLRKPNLQITGVEVMGAKALDAREIVIAAEKDFSGNYVWVVPKSNVLLFSKILLKDKLLEQFPGIDDLTISFRTKNAITITITEKQPKDIWCTDTSTCYFIDDSGVIFKPAPLFSDGVYVMFSGATLQLPDNIIRARFMTAVDFATIKSLLKALEKYPIKVLEIHFDTGGDITLRVESIKDYQLNSATKILITAGTNEQAITENLDLLLADKVFTSGLISHGVDLETVDLRFAGKIYYKFKNGAPVSSGTSSTTTKP